MSLVSPISPTLAIDFSSGNLWIGFAVTLFFVICLILILTILIQRPQGGGLAGAFGSGAGSGQTAFGAKTGDALTIATITIFVVYLGGAIFLNFVVRPSEAVATTTAASSEKPADDQPTGTPFQPETSGGTTTTTVTPAPAAPTPPAPPAPNTTEPGAAAPAPAPTSPATPPAPSGDAPKTDTPAANPPATPAPTPAPTAPPSGGGN